eukprot:7923943-Pyramimonas_sp.AAC.1
MLQLANERYHMFGYQMIARRSPSHVTHNRWKRSTKCLQDPHTDHDTARGDLDTWYPDVPNASQHGPTQCVSRNVCCAIHVVQYMWYTVYGGTHVVQTTLCNPVLCNRCGAQWIRCNRRGAIRVVQLVLCNICCAVQAVRPMWCAMLRCKRR